MIHYFCMANTQNYVGFTWISDEGKEYNTIINNIFSNDNPGTVYNVDNEDNHFVRLAANYIKKMGINCQLKSVYVTDFNWMT